MFDRRKIDYYMVEIEDCIRSHTKHRANQMRIREKIADIAIAGESIPDDVTQSLKDEEFNAEFYQNRLNDIKSEFIKTIENVQIEE